MKQYTYERLIYAGAMLPLTIGTVIFFYWFYQRSFHAMNVHIELISFFIIVTYLVFSCIILIFSVLYFFQFKNNWKRIAPALFILVFTVPALFTYGTMYDLHANKTYVRVVNDLDSLNVYRIRSANFSIDALEKKGNDFVVSYEPVYEYDWTKEDSFGFEYEIKEIFIDLVSADNMVHTYEMPVFEKGVCAHIKVSALKESKQ
jgi:hypothetical protein